MEKPENSFLGYSIFSEYRRYLFRYQKAQALLSFLKYLFYDLLFLRLR